ncbi:MAG: isochorismatase family protein [Candidatus Binatia bacterium]
MTDAKIELQPESTGLVIVDMQVEGCERHGPGVRPVIGNIRRLLDRFRAVNGKIIHVQSVRTRITLNSPSSDGRLACCSAARARISSRN